MSVVKQKTHTEIPEEHTEDLTHGFAHVLIEANIFWIVIGFAVLGILAKFRKQLKAWLLK